MTASKAKCPHCGETTHIDRSNPYRPFCSERCRLIDLGAWLNGSNRLPSDEPVNFDDLEDSDITRH